jgi:hypothetical protein
VHANKVSVPVREKSVHELNVCEKLVHELNACEIPVHKLDICEIPVHAIPVLPENSHAERSIVQNEFRMLVSEPIDNSFANEEDPVIPLSEDPDREVTREQIEYFLQKIQIQYAPSETGATNRSIFTNLPSAIVFRTCVTLGYEIQNSLVDTGASISAINPDILIRAAQSIVKRQNIQSFSFKFSVGNSESLCVNEIVTMNFYINSTLFNWKFYVIPGLSNNVVLGMDWLSQIKAILHCDNQSIRFSATPESAAPVPQIQQLSNPVSIQTMTQTPNENKPSIPKRPENRNVSTKLFTMFPSGLKANHSCSIDVMCSNANFNGDILVTSNNDLEHKKLLLIGRSIIPMINGKGQVWIINANDYDIRLPPNSEIGSFEEFESDTDPYDVSNVEMNYLQDLENSPIIPDNELYPQLSSIEESDRADKLFEACTFGDKLTKEQRDRLKSLICEYLDVFSFSDEKIGRAIGVKHKINRGDAVPIRQRAYRVSPTERELIRGKVEQLTKQGLIRPSESPWSSPVILVSQKDKVRFVVDYRKLNAVTKKDSYPLPLISDYLDHLQGSEYFTSMDCDTAFHQVPMSEEDREKTAFVVPDGSLHEYNVLSFGLCNAPSTFQRLIDRVLGSLKWKIALVYIDDTVVFSKYFDQHLIDLRLVLEAFRRSRLTLKPLKCIFANHELEFLGHVVSKEGV